MSNRRRPQPQLDPPEERAKGQVAETPSADLDGLTDGQVRALTYELEVHKVELETQNRQLREAQRETLASHERFRHLYDSAPTGYLTLDPDGTITEANLSVTATLKLPRSRLVGSTLSSYVSAHCQDRLHLAMRELQEGRSRTDLTLEMRSAAGDAIDAQIVAMAVGDGNRGPSEIRVSLIDVTELRRTEHALQAAVAAAVQVEERERRKLAADLHDDVGQLLALASLKLHALRDAEEVERDSWMAELEELLAKTRRRISTLSFQLSPPLLHDVGLVAALRWLADDLRNSYGLVVKITEEQEIDLDENVRTLFFRATRELLLNVVKHSGVKEARIRITGDERMARIAVEDGGVGMPPRAKRRGFGLLALRERVEQLGGSLETRGSANLGTTSVVSLPIRVSIHREVPW